MNNDFTFTFDTNQFGGITVDDEQKPEGVRDPVGFRDEVQVEVIRHQPQKEEEDGKSSKSDS